LRGAISLWRSKRSTVSERFNAYRRSSGL
jgi:hypothetical protein